MDLLERARQYTWYQVLELAPGGFTEGWFDLRQYVPYLPVPAVRFRADRDKGVVFWKPGARGWARMIRTAGFDRVDERARFTARSRRGFSVRHVVHHATRA